MKKVSLFVLSGLMVLATQGVGMAEGKTKVYQCPMDQYTVPANCPLCGMKLEEKEIGEAEAHAAIDKTNASESGHKH